MEMDLSGEDILHISFEVLFVSDAIDHAIPEQLILPGVPRLDESTVLLFAVERTEVRETSYRTPSATSGATGFGGSRFAKAPTETAEATIVIRIADVPRLTWRPSVRSTLWGLRAHLGASPDVRWRPWVRRPLQSFHSGVRQARITVPGRQRQPREPRYGAGLRSHQTRERSHQTGELSGCVRQLNGCVRELSGCVRELSGCVRELSGCVRELSDCVREFSDCVRELNSIRLRRIAESGLAQGASQGRCGRRPGL